MRASCPACGSLPDRVEARWKGNEPVGEPLPPAVAGLEVVGAPCVREVTSHSSSHLKRCPRCGTCFRWVYSHEYLVGGDEDEVELTRLTRHEGRRQQAAVLRAVAALERRFREGAVSHLAALTPEAAPEDARAAAEYFFYQGAMQGFDLAFAATALRARQQVEDPESLTHHYLCRCLAEKTAPVQG